MSVSLDNVNGLLEGNLVSTREIFPSNIDPLTKLMNAVSSAAADNRSKLTSLKKVTVPNFGEKWRFPSDHLPVGCTVNGRNIVSWNVMNSAYMSWVTEKNSQGLNGSIITELDIQIENKPGLTQRDVVIIQDILSMLQSPTTPKHVLALQEASAPFIKELVRELPKNYQVILPTGPFKGENDLIIDQNMMIIDTNAFTYLPEISKPQYYIYSGSESTRPTMDVMLEDVSTKEKFRIVNSHVPGNPLLASRQEFADHVVKPNFSNEEAFLIKERENSITIALGDMNFDQNRMQLAFDLATEKSEGPHFTRITPYRTNIGGNFDTKEVTLCAKAIDHFFVSSVVNDQPVNIKGMDYREIYPLQDQINRIRSVLELFMQHTNN